MPAEGTVGDADYVRRKHLRDLDLKLQRVHVVYNQFATSLRLQAHDKTGLADCDCVKIIVSHLPVFDSYTKYHTRYVINKPKISSPSLGYTRLFSAKSGTKESPFFKPISS